MKQQGLAMKVMALLLIILLAETVSATHQQLTGAEEIHGALSLVQPSQEQGNVQSVNDDTNNHHSIPRQSFDQHNDGSNVDNHS